MQESTFIGLGVQKAKMPVAVVHAQKFDAQHVAVLAQLDIRLTEDDEEIGSSGPVKASMSHAAQSRR
jgi:hypothetical protein